MKPIINLQITVSEIQNEKSWENVGMPQTDKNKITNQQIEAIKPKKEEGLINYKLLTISDFYWQCSFPIAVNHNNTIIIVGGYDITILEFEYGKLEIQQILNESLSRVNVLSFFKKSNRFISADGKGTSNLRIWNKNIHKKWYCEQQLQSNHVGKILGGITNDDENLMIFFGSDSKIYFWTNKDFANLWKCQQKLVVHEGEVYFACLNSSGDQLVSSATDNSICVSYLSPQNKWRKMQRVIVSNYGGVCFLDNSFFAFKSSEIEYLIIFKLNLQNMNFQTFKEIYLGMGEYNDFSFPMTFDRSKSILACKVDRYIHFIGQRVDDKFIPEQHLEFKHHMFFGRMSYDGEYIFIRDEEEGVFKIFSYV